MTGIFYIVTRNADENEAPMSEQTLIVNSAAQFPES